MKETKYKISLNLMPSTKTLQNTNLADFSLTTC